MHTAPTSQIARAVWATAALLTFAAWGAAADTPQLSRNLFFSDGKGRLESLSEDPEKPIRAILSGLDAKATLSPLKIDYPPQAAVFPPKIVPPQFLWHDEADAADTWLVDVAFHGGPHHLYIWTAGLRVTRELDPYCITDDNVYEETPYQKSARGWIPSERVWELIKRHSAEANATITLLGLQGAVGEQNTPAARVVSRGTVVIRTSKDPVGAPIFYRDVPIMPAKNTGDAIRPLAASGVAMIKWRIRDISKPSAPVVMKDMPTCANCHSFAYDGHTLGMDMDGPSAEGETMDKGAYFVKTIEKRMVIEDEDIFSWNDFKDKPKDKDTIGLFPQVSPDGKAVATTINESIFIVNYMDYRFCQTFYPTRGVIGIYDRETKEISTLPGANLEEYVQGNPVWSPDGKSLVFIRAKARDRYGPGPKPTKANDPEETQIQFDLYRIPYNDRQGGTAEPIPGASNNGMSNSFPKFSPDGKWIVFVQARNGLLMRPDSKLYIIPAQGGQPRLMNCNTTLMNSWHSWSPNGRWLVFSSKSNTPYTRMFLTHIDENGIDTPAVLIPNSTLANRAVNIPEFFNNDPDALQQIVAPAVDYRRHMRKGLDLVAKGKIEEAILQLQKSHSMKPDYPDALIHLGRLLGEAGKLDEAVEKFYGFVEKNPESALAYINLGVVLSMRGDTEQGIKNFKRALELDPEYGSAHANWGHAAIALNDLDGGIEHFRKALELAPESESAHCDLGDAYQAKGMTDEAIQHYDLALRVNPQSAKAYTRWGVALLRSGRGDTAGAVFRRALELDPRYAPAHLQWGIALMAEGQLEPAAQHFEELIELNPQDASARYHLGNALSALGQQDRAIGQLERALQLDPQRRGAHYSLADIYATRRQLDEAILHYQEEVRIDPRNDDVYVDWGNTLSRNKLIDEAMPQYLHAVELNPKSERAHYFLARALCTQGKFDRAAQHYEKILAMNPKAAPVHTDYGMALLKMRRVDQATQHLRKALELNPQDQRARKALQSIQNR